MGEAKRRLAAQENMPLRIDYGVAKDPDGNVEMVRMRFSRPIRFVDFKLDEAIRAAQSLAFCARPLPMEGKTDGAQPAAVSDDSRGVCGNAGGGEGDKPHAAPGGENRLDADTP
jgi:hypothetical protein